jgi:hypothetical protein
LPARVRRGAPPESKACKLSLLRELGVERASAAVRTLTSLHNQPLSVRR